MSRVDLLLVLVVILIIVLIWRGPSMLPQIGAALGLAVKGAREKMDSDDDGVAPASSPAPPASSPAPPASSPAPPASTDSDDADPPPANRS